MRDIADEKHLTIPQLLTAWVLAQGDNILALTGARKVAQLQELIKTQNANLDKADFERIEKAVPKDAVSSHGISMKFKGGMIVR